ncbi:glutamate--cysteine ligase [Hydrogenophaga sp. RWCD_12]|uniref:glutamate--cysteine ligase n=1 Tax=Hydrogenophaga sp. RWCD_12 TaxID=3391190 RepID=UPI0039853FF5
MSSVLMRRLAFLSNGTNRPLLAQGYRGIEREALRVDVLGHLASTLHPRRLGSALTHPHVTTDYSEALLEIITPPAHDPAAMHQRLDLLHRHVASRLGPEMMWSHSMPCRLPPEEEIPIGLYGTSHIGTLKHVYRRGLALRYGKSMQCIAGIHYNYSVAEEVWQRLKAEESGSGSLVHHQSESYIALIRNFRRCAWLLMYLFGASPAVSREFPVRREMPLQNFSSDTVYMPYATSLRMSGIGYQNNGQAGLTPDYNTLDTYVKSLAAAMNQPHQPYVDLGTKRNGEWVQVNTNKLQIENEYYSSIRPKRVTKPGERPLHALSENGVQYIEVRCLDIDPFEPLGVGLETCRFLDTFLLFCALDESPLTITRECRENTHNFALTVEAGRRPGLSLIRDGVPISLKMWGLEMLNRMQEVAALLDSLGGNGEYTLALAAQKNKVRDPELTPSARVLTGIREHNSSFYNFAQHQSVSHHRYFLSHPPSDSSNDLFDAMALQSLEEQVEIERNDTGSFDDFVKRYQDGILYAPPVEAATPLPNEA